MDQPLRGIKLGKFQSDDRIARTNTLDLLVHRDRFEMKFLFAVVSGDAFEARNGLLFFARANVKITQHIQGSKIVSVVIDDLTILLDRGVDLPL